MILYFKNGSTLSVGAALDSDRGKRTHASLIDEARDHDGQSLQEIIIPQMNVSRRMANGLINPYEPLNIQIIYATSAGTKSSFAYEALLDYFEESIIDPKNAFVMGLDYRIPVKHGLIDQKQVQSLKLSPTYDEIVFAAEYMGQWIGGSQDSWFQFDRMTHYRKLKNPEWKPHLANLPKAFYLLSCDIARVVGGDQSVVNVFKVMPHTDGRFFASLVNLFVLGKTDFEKTFDQQCLAIKKLIAIYNPREVLIDINGIGRGIADVMIKPQYDSDGTLYPAYGFFNNDDYKKIQPKDAPAILYGMIASNSLNPKINANAYQRINSGLVRFLISEQEARQILLSTEKGQKMKTEARIERLMPHELTTKLFTEMANLRLKKTGVDIQLERINAHYPKDKYSAFSYGLWRIKELEDEAQKRNRKYAASLHRQLTFYTGGV